MALWLQDMCLWHGFSPKASRLLIREHGLDSLDKLRVLMDKIVDGICNVVKKSGNKNAERMPNREQQVSVMVQENLKLAAFLFHHRWRYPLGWDVMGVHEDTVHLLARQKRLKDECNNPNMLSKVNKFNMEGTMEAIKEYLRLCHGVIKAPLACISERP